MDIVKELTAALRSRGKRGDLASGAAMLFHEEKKTKKIKRASKGRTASRSQWIDEGGGRARKINKSLVEKSERNQGLC